MVEHWGYDRHVAGLAAAPGLYRGPGRGLATGCYPARGRALLGNLGAARREPPSQKSPTITMAYTPARGRVTRWGKWTGGWVGGRGPFQVPTTYII